MALRSDPPVMGDDFRPDSYGLSRINAMRDLADISNELIFASCTPDRLDCTPAWEVLARNRVKNSKNAPASSGKDRQFAEA